MAERISQESDPGRWQALYEQWISEKRPGYVVTKVTTYRVLKLPNNTIVFEKAEAQGMYESTSF